MSTQLARDFRTILKHFKSLPSYNSSNVYKEFVSKVEIGKKVIDKKEIERLKEATKSYAMLVSSIKEASRLRGLDSGEKLDPRDKIRATANRVGLGVPQFSDEANFNDRIY